LLDVLTAFFRLGAHLPHPGGRSLLQFGMMLVFLSARGGAQRNPLLAALDFVAGCFCDKRTAPRPRATARFPAAEIKLVF
jgi:hypothetical protein